MTPDKKQVNRAEKIRFIKILRAIFACKLEKEYKQALGN
jgi:hypothetical protein